MIKKFCDQCQKENPECEEFVVFVAQKAMKDQCSTGYWIDKILMKHTTMLCPACQKIAIMGLEKK